MPTPRTLSLKREALAELTRGDLANVVGASGECTGTTSIDTECEAQTLPVHYCLTLAGPRCIF